MPRREEILEDDEARRIIEELYDKGHGLADYVIEQILGTQLTREEREDLIQDGFLRMIIHVEKLRNKSEGERISYMYSTMRNVAIDEGRRLTRMKLLGYREERTDVEIVSPNLTPEERYMMEQDVRDKRRRLRIALERLTEQERALLVEKYHNGLSDREIGAKLGIKPRNVRVYMARARRKASIYYGEVLNEERDKQTAHRSGPKTGAEGDGGDTPQRNPV